MGSRFFILAAFSLLLAGTVRATTLPPELKAYDFGEAYYVEDGGVVISPYSHGFYCPDGIETPEGIRVMPGVSFMQFDEARKVVDKYTLIRLNEEANRAFFHQQTYRYKMVKNREGKWHPVILDRVATNNFYLSKWRTLEWFDHAFPYLELHPGAEGWRTRPQY